MTLYIQTLNRPDLNVVIKCVPSSNQIYNVTITIRNYGAPAHNVDIFITSSGVANITKVESGPPVQEISYEIENVSFPNADNGTLVRSKLNRIGNFLNVRFELSVGDIQKPVPQVLVTSDEAEILEIGETDPLLNLFGSIGRLIRTGFPYIVAILLFVAAYIIIRAEQSMAISS